MKCNIYAKKCIITLLVAVLVTASGCKKTADLTVEFTGMGTVISLKLYGGNAQEASIKLSELYSDIENACSLTVENSPINELNLTGHTDNTHIVRQAEEAIRLYERTSGALDITAGAVTSLWRIGFSDACVPDDERLKEATKKVDGSLLKTENGVLYMGQGQKADLGALTKGYALDETVAVLKEYNVNGAVVAVGGSVLFYGSNGKSWNCGVRDPFGSGGILGTFKLTQGFVSTSGSYERYFVEDGVTYHHIIDPSTGYPAVTDLVSVTVVADNGLLSDALSTAAFILGVEKGSALLNEYGYSGIFVAKDGTITVVGDIDFEKA